MRVGKKIEIPVIGPRGATQIYGHITIVDEHASNVNKGDIISLTLKVDAGGYKSRWSEAHTALLKEFAGFLQAHLQTFEPFPEEGKTE